MSRPGLGINPYLQCSNSQKPQPGYLGTVQPIRACPEDPWGCFSSTSALEASSPGHRRQRNSIGRQARSPQARRLTLHRPVLNPDPTLCPSERLSPAPCRRQHAHRSTSASPQAWHKLPTAVHCSVNLSCTTQQLPRQDSRPPPTQSRLDLSQAARQTHRRFRRRGQVQPSRHQLPHPKAHV